MSSGKRDANLVKMFHQKYLLKQFSQKESSVAVPRDIENKLLKPMMNQWRLWLSLLLVVAVTACSGILPSNLFSSQPSPEVLPTSPSAPSPSATVQATSGPPAPAEMILWLPPKFNPTEDNAAAKILNARLEQFSSLNKVKIVVRLKADSGSSGLLESLNAASAAAPLNLPSVVALSRADLEAAAIKGLLVSLDGTSSAIDNPDWFEYARQLAMVQGVTFGLPFAGDALVLVYRPSKVNPAPSSWANIQKLHQPVAFSAANPQALITSALYQSVGGAVEDSQRRPSLQADKLASVLQLFKEGAQNGIFPSWLTQYETDGQAWQAYQDQRVNIVLTWSSDFLSELPPDSIALPLPPLGNASLTLSSGWCWAVADNKPERRALSIQLAEWLSSPDFIASWSEAAGYIPARPTALANWKDQSLKTIFSEVALSAHARPSNDLINSLGPVLKEATLKVIRLEAEPSQAAGAAAERLAAPPSK